MKTGARRRVEPTSRKRTRGGASSATAARRSGVRKSSRSPIPEELSQAAALLGRLGGLKGGAARARALSTKRKREIASAGGAARASTLSDERRSEIAKAGARARWGPKKG